jgi:DNA-binding NarL/FixJ family response regulator
MIRVLVVDDHNFFRSTLADVIEACDDLELAGQCSDGVEVAAAVADLRPDVIVMDVRMSHMSGIEAARAMKQDGDAPAVIMLSSDDSARVRAAAREAAAVGYLLKGGHVDEVLEAIRQAAGGTVRLRLVRRCCRRLPHVSNHPLILWVHHSPKYGMGWGPGWREAVRRQARG